MQQPRHRLQSRTVILALLAAVALPPAQAGAAPAAEATTRPTDLALPARTGKLLPGPASITPTPAVQPAAPGLLACLILPGRTAEIGSPVVGVVASVDVERGDFVHKGQVLARLRADVEQANSGVARSRADSEGEWRAAVASQELAKLKLDRARHLKDQNFVSGQAVEQAESEHQVALQRANQAREALQVSAREASSAQAQLSQRTLRAPFDGVITERFANPGERYEEKPLLKLADLRQLRVDVVASTSLFGSLRVGQPITVRPELPGLPVQTALISQIDQVMDPASNTFRVRLSLPNPDGVLPAGLRCKAEVSRGAGVAATPPAGAMPTAATAVVPGTPRTVAPAPGTAQIPRQGGAAGLEMDLGMTRAAAPSGAKAVVLGARP